MERLERRQLLASDFTNPLLSRDVSNDRKVTARDALQVINALNNGGTRELTPTADPVEIFVDVNGDGSVSALDALIIINALGDETPPVFSASLANDTGPDGPNQDDLTFDPTISGLAEDALGVAFLTVQIDGNPAFDLTELDDAGFSFDPGFATDGSDDGRHVLTVSATDERGNTSESQVLEFVLDTQVDAQLIQARATNLEQGTGELEGIAELGVQLTVGDQVIDVEAEAGQRFTFDGLAIVEGDNAFAVNAIDRAGNSRLVEQTLVVEQDPIVELQLQVDTDRDQQTNDDRITSNPTVIGTIADLSQIARLSVSLNSDDEADLVDVTDLVADGTFTLDAAAFNVIAGQPIADGEQIVRVVAEDVFGNTSFTTTMFFELDQTGPGLTVNVPGAQEILTAESLIEGTVDAGDPSIQLTYRFAGGPEQEILFINEGAFAEVLDFRGVENGPTQLIITAQDAVGNLDETVIDVNIQLETPFRLEESFPTDGSIEAGLTIKPRIDFTRPIDPTSVSSDNLFLSSSGQKLDANL
ncbi:MAG: dockerin type I domain-containing protein, partial [Planctomycetota bacterium]